MENNITENKPAGLERVWHQFFEWSLLIKGFNGAWETISGVLILFSSKATLDNFFYFLARRELLEDPNDKLINFFTGALNSVSNDAKTFVAFYILFHGFLNIFLAIQLYRNKLWAYLFTIGAISLLMLYQIYRIIVHHSLVLTAITIFDVLFIILVWHEYKHRKKDENF